LTAHFIYWCVFGNFNDLPLDDYHIKQLFVSLIQTMSTIEYQYKKTEKQRVLFSGFIMPMIILAIRVEIEIIFKMNYRQFLLARGRGADDTDNQDLPH